jgi:hypothetical protein
VVLSLQRRNTGLRHSFHVFWTFISNCCIPVDPAATSVAQPLQDSGSAIRTALTVIPSGASTDLG